MKTLTCILCSWDKQLLADVFARYGGYVNQPMCQQLIYECAPAKEGLNAFP